MKSAGSQIRVLKSSPIKLLNATRIGSKINVKVQLVSTKVKSPEKSPIKSISISALASSLYRHNTIEVLPKMLASSNQQTVRNPDDFIEPEADLAIPSTEVFFQHKKFIEHVPAIIDREENLKSKQKEESSVMRNSKSMYKTMEFSTVKKLWVKTKSKSLDFDINRQPIKKTLAASNPKAQRKIIVKNLIKF